MLLVDVARLVAAEMHNIDILRYVPHTDVHILQGFRSVFRAKPRRTAQCGCLYTRHLVILALLLVVCEVARAVKNRHFDGTRHRLVSRETEIGGASLS